MKNSKIDIRELLRLIQSVSSPKVEPLKLWLARIGSEQIEEVFNPEIAIDRAIDCYRSRGYTDQWISDRLKEILYEEKMWIFNWKKLSVQI